MADGSTLCMNYLANITSLGPVRSCILLLLSRRNTVSLLAITFTVYAGGLEALRVERWFPCSFARHSPTGARPESALLFHCETLFQDEVYEGRSGNIKFPRSQARRWIRKYPLRKPAGRLVSSQLALLQATLQWYLNSSREQVGVAISR